MRKSSVPPHIRDAHSLPADPTRPSTCVVHSAGGAWTLLLVAALAVSLAACDTPFAASGDVGLSDASGTDASGTDAIAAASDVDTAATDAAASDIDTASHDVAVDVSCDLENCSDGNPCTTDGCDASGCTHTPATSPCDDGDACTSGDLCAGLGCAGASVSCSDGIACTLDSCDPKIGCVHLAGASTVCEDGNACTDDACEVGLGCTHAANTGPCNDGNACTLAEACSSSLCLATGATTVCDDGNPCTTDACDAKTGLCGFAANTAPCDDGDPCTFKDTCATTGCAGALDCPCALAAAQALAAIDDCTTPFDDNCDGAINEATTCGATVYKFGAPPECSFYCYYDEAHNIAVNGAGTGANPAGFDVFASGQLFDGIKGVDDWAADTGAGPAYEWVAWSLAPPVITVQFPQPRNVALLRLGMDNFKGGDVVQPPQIELRFSQDGQMWTAAQVFQIADGTEAAIPEGKRGDVVLSFAMQTARFVEVSFVTSGKWTFVDELAFD